MQNLITSLRLNKGHFGFITLVAFSTLAFLLDAWEASDGEWENLLLAAPMSVIVIALCGFVVVQVLFLGDAPALAETPESAGENPEAPRFDGALTKIFAAMGLLALYVFTMEYVGFDLATFIYLVANFTVLGERRPLITFGFSAVFTVFCVWGLKVLMPYPFKTWLF